MLEARGLDLLPSQVSLARTSRCERPPPVVFHVFPTTIRRWWPTSTCPSCPAYPLQTLAKQHSLLILFLPFPTPQSVANKGEPFLSGITPSADGVAAFLAPAGLALLSYASPKDMVGAMLPHCPWSDRRPPIASFYYYAAAVKE